jgi:hypothetical protein
VGGAPAGCWIATRICNPAESSIRACRGVRRRRRPAHRRRGCGDAAGRRKLVCPTRTNYPGSSALLPWRLLVPVARRGRTVHRLARAVALSAASAAVIVLGYMGRHRKHVRSVPASPVISPRGPSSMRPSGLEPPRTKRSTRPSTLYARRRWVRGRPDRPFCAVSGTHGTHRTN